MDEEDQQQQDLDDRQQRIALLHHIGVLVEDLRPEEDQQVSADVDQEVKEKCKAGNADEDLRADR